MSTFIRNEDAVLEYSAETKINFKKWQNLVDMVFDGGYNENIGSTIIDLSGREPEIITTEKGSYDIL